MRLSETGLSTARRPQRPDLMGPTRQERRRSFINRTSLSLGLAVLLVGAAVGAIAFGRLMVTRAAGTMPNEDCTLVLPNNPLSARGLATPFKLVATDPNQGPCNEANPDQSAFAQGAVLNPVTGQIAVYDPLVIDQGTQPAAAPVVPKLPADAIVALWFGSNGNTLRLKGGQGANCVNGVGNSVFGQYSYCNAPLFFLVANRLIRQGKITVPALGTANDGLPCPTTRDFSVVDQDQSDNVTTAYLVTDNGQTAQDTPANQTALPNAHAQNNGSDNGLLVGPLDTALGCTPWMVPDLASPDQMLTALPLNELQAAADQQDPIALVPLGDPMTLLNNHENLTKTNLYRLGVDQVPARTKQQASTATYCQNLLQIAPPRLQMDMAFTSAVASPDPAAANNLFTFLAQRFVASYEQNLNCTGLLNQPDPVTIQMDGNGVAVSAAINLNGNTGGTGGNTGGNNGGGNNGGNGGNNGGNGGTGGNNGGNNGGAGGTGGAGTGQGTTPTCVINGVTVQNCSGTTTITQTCQVSYDANTNQIMINCPGK